MSSYSPSGGINEIACSVSNLLSFTHCKKIMTVTALVFLSELKPVTLIHLMKLTIINSDGAFGL
jgi:hypothetical protein